MAAFKEHVNIATIVTGVIIITLYNAEFLTLYQTLTALFIGILGGILPDIDSDSSIPLQTIFKIFSIIIPLLLLLILFPSMPIVKTIFLWIVLTIILKLTLFKIFLHLTHHRGIFHSIPMAVLVGEITFAIALYGAEIDVQVAAIYGFIIFFGFMIHLLLDEIYSVNAFGIKMKKSFGTALKFYDKHNRAGTFLLYIFAISLYFLLPNVNKIVLHFIETLSNIKLL